MIRSSRPRDVRRSLPRTGFLFTATLFLLGSTPTGIAAPTRAESHGVYVRLLESGSGTLSQVVEAVKSGLDQNGFQVLADHRVGVDADACSFGAHVIVANDAGYAQQVLAHGPGAAFALPLRVAVFEDETGVHAALANPLSLNRTIISEDGVADLSAGIIERVRQAVVSTGVGEPATGEYGQMRDRGLIGKTMGIMAGGPFPSKIDDVTTVDLADFGGLDGLTERLMGIEAGGGEWKWGARAVYSVTYPEHGIAIVGVSGDRMEADAFSIVGEGSDDARKDFACPGLDHAAAFPVEVVVAAKDGRATLRLVDEMFRMKMYFEDAGKMKFAMNMRMPGSIESEIRDKIDEILY